MNIEWSEPALSDIENIREYIGKDSQYYASRFIGKIILSVEKLEKFPELGRKVPEAEDNEGDIRELLFQNYRIMYRVESQRILILTIIHAAREISAKEQKPWDII